MGNVKELRLVLTVRDFEAAVALYRDALRLEEVEAWEGEKEGARLRSSLPVAPRSSW